MNFLLNFVICNHKKINIYPLIGLHKMNEGLIVQVIGPVVDVEFAPGTIPAVMNALEIPRKNIETGADEVLICEVQQHLGEDRVRTVSMETTDGLVRGMKAFDTGSPISVPVGPEILGRMVNCQ